MSVDEIKASWIETYEASFDTTRHRADKIASTFGDFVLHRARDGQSNLRDCNSGNFSVAAALSERGATIVHYCARTRALRPIAFR